MFSAIYYFLALALYILAQPVLFFLSFKQKYKTSLRARFWRISVPKSAEIWIHACSLGEVTSLKPIVENLGEKIVISTITQTGFARARELFKERANISVCYLPFEIFLPFYLPKMKKLIVLEAELWFMLFWSAKKNGAKTMLLNARISQKSAPSYLKNRWFYKKIFNLIDLILCQQERDKEILKQLGAKNIEVIGNIKALNTPKTSKNLEKFSGILFVGASTHEGEEELIIESFLKARQENWRLIIAPRHPERFKKVFELMRENGARMSEVGLDFSKSILLLDSLGELINIYSIADVVILGGSFAEVGGHNPLECAHFGAKIISGKHIFNQLALYSMVENIAIIEDSELESALKNIDKLKKSKIKNIDLNLIMQKIGS